MIQGRTVLVTGAASGIGAETSRQLVALGANVVLIDVRAAALEELARSLGQRALAAVADVTRLDELEAAVRASVERFGRVDAVVANAGIEALGASGSMAPEDFRRVVDVDLVGAWLTARAALPALTATRGYLLLVSSLAAATPGPRNAAYNAAKAGVVAVAKTLRLELSGSGVAVGVAYFSYIDTDTGRASVESPVMADVMARIPSRMLTPTPVRVAAAGVVRGIDRRQRRVLVPRSGWAAVMFPELAHAIAERLLRERR
jgi:NAD(P)-dependent dehydrogenase (short-subunit alcohol dehydrogenase family)